jgi:hypothetical protein
VKNIFAPEARKDREIFEGGLEKQVDLLMNRLRGLKCV